MWTVLLAGAGIRGGTIVGASDHHAAEPADRPVSPPELVATIYHSLGLDARTAVDAFPLLDAQPIRELF